jgi:hypothetical protein
MRAQVLTTQSEVRLSVLIAGKIPERLRMKPTLQVTAVLGNRLVENTDYHRDQAVVGWLLGNILPPMILVF